VQSLTAFQFLSVFLISGLSTLLLTEAYRRHALKTGIIDTPNHRSSHTQPTPRGGGISIVISHGLLLVYAVYAGLLSREVAIPFIICSGIVAITGFIDDYRSLSSRIRFSIHLGASLLALALLPQLPTLALGHYELGMTGVGLIFAAIGLTWLINLYNFMDGIDGIATTEAITVLIGASLILLGHNNNAELPLLLIAPLLGFLALNMPPAKIFMGDSCSGYLGISLGLLAIITSSSTAMNLWCWVILLAVFICDSSWTLVTRILTGQRWQEAHRSHAYQILSRKQQSHGQITIGVAAINIFWLTPLAWLASLATEYAAILALIAYLPLCLICAKQKAGSDSQ